ncbi:MAG TPA: hypothetical protein VHN59_06105 [Chitinophagaceae bacterium]|nr:hypothetical protein [Chitinophagaceae bacterium]
MHRIYWLTIILCAGLSSTSLAQKPKDGTYTYAIAWDEWGGKTLGATCTVIIKGDSIKVVHNGKHNVSGNKGEIMEQGLIRRHKKTGKWIIAHSEKDIHAKEIGGCGDGPTVIDFVKKQWHSC